MEHTSVECSPLLSYTLGKLALYWRLFFTGHTKLSVFVDILHGDRESDIWHTHYMINNSDFSVLIVAVLLNNFSTSWACLQPSRLQMVGSMWNTMICITTGNLQSNQLYIAAFKWFKWFKVHVAYSSRTNMTTENINGAPQQLYTASFIGFRTMNRLWYVWCVQQGLVKACCMIGYMHVSLWSWQSYRLASRQC